jgi:hypothetical protein
LIFGNFLLLYQAKLFRRLPLRERVDKSVEEKMDIQTLMQHVTLAPARNSIPLKQADETPGSQDSPPRAVAVEEEQPWLAEPNMKGIESMAAYLAVKQVEASLALELAKVAYTSFKNELSKLRPELAGKDFSFGLDVTGSIQIIDTHGSLSGEEKTWLAERLNHRGLKGHLTDHFETSVLLTKYDKTGFTAGYKLEVKDLARLIDYGRILESDNMQQTWKNQISERGEKRTPFISERI